MISADDKRIPGLDGLRAVSILIVVLSHISYSTLKVDHFYLTGNLGVRIFFAISGFLITGILLRELESEGKIRLLRFYFRRAMRIVPAFVFFLGLIYVYLFYINAPVGSVVYPLTYTTDYFFTRVPVEVRHTWSLAVEEKFYLVFPVILAFAGVKYFRRFLWIVIVATPVMRYFTERLDDPEKLVRMAWNFHLNMDVLATGCLLAVLRPKLHENRVYKWCLESFPALAAVFLITFAAGYFSPRNFPMFYAFGVTLMNFGIVFSIDWLVVNRDSMLGRILNFRPLAYIGVLSYSIYLWQEPFTFYAESSPWTHLPYNLILLASFAVFTYYFVEKKFLDLRRDLEPRLFTSRPKPVAAPESLSYGTNR